MAAPPRTRAAAVRGRRPLLAVGAFAVAALLASRVAGEGAARSAGDSGRTPGYPTGRLVTATRPTPTPAPTAAPVTTRPGSAAAARQIAPAVAPLRRRLRPDVLVTSARPLPRSFVAALRRLAPKGGTVVVRVGTVELAGTKLRALAVDPSTFRSFAPKGTAEATPVWAAVARGEAAVDHATAKRLGLPLGGRIPLGGRGPAGIRLGALATMGIPDLEVIVSDAVGESLGLGHSTGAVIAAGDTDPARLAASARKVAGKTARIDLLPQPAASPVAFLTGADAAKAFGSFSYRYFADGRIQPDRAWVARNIVTADVPLIGRVTCHRLMIRQLRGALADIERAGLGRHVRRSQYGGCYVPRFVERNPDRSISLHTWGIAVDLNVPTNLLGSHGDMHPGVVAAFDRWGFRWGGRWSHPDPMHFELGALLDQ